MHILLLKELLLFRQKKIEPLVRNLILKNNASFVKCISKINNVLINNPKDLNIVMSMYNLIEYSKNYSETSGTL